MNTRTLSVLLALSTPLVAQAGARKLPEYDISTEDAALKSAKKWSIKTKGAPKAYPKKVAIGMFGVRYLFKETSAGKNTVTYTTLKFGDAEYTQLTDQLYAQLKARLEAEGLEVVDRDAVVQADAYKALKADDSKKGNAKRVTYSPTGMKNLPIFSGQPRNPGGLAALNTELGTDAVVAGFVSIGVCDIESTKKTGNRNGTYACIKGDLTMPGFNLTFIGGAKGSGDKTKPEWTSRLYKEVEIYNYGKDVAYDMALVAGASAMSEVNNGFWKKNSLATDEAAFVGGSGAIYDDLLTMSFAWWEKKMGSRRSAAGVDRGAVAAAVPEDGAAPSAPAEPQTFSVPPLPGTVSCYSGTSTSGNMAVRRGLDADGSRIIEDSITFLEGQPPYRGVAVYSVDGSNATVADHGGAWNGTAAFDGAPWSAAGWTMDLKMPANGATIASTYTLADGALRSSAEVTLDGKVVATVTSDLATIDETACNELFAGVAPIEGAW